jgi:hypothetical protein
MMIGNGVNGRAGERGIGADPTRLAKEKRNHGSTRSPSLRSGV